MNFHKRIVIFVAFPLLILGFIEEYKVDHIKPIPYSSVLQSMKIISDSFNNTLIITVVSSHLFKNLLLRRKALRLNDNQHVEQKTIVICLDRKCILYCELYRMHNCFFTAEYELRRKSKMFTKDYIRINYEKFQILDSALAITDNALLIDSDVLLFRDPWPTLLSTGYQVQWQSENYTAGKCHVEPNGGLLSVNRDARRFFMFFYRNKDVILNAKTMSETDQAFILPSVIESHVNGCALSSDIFVGNCQFKRDNNVNFDTLVSFHATCASHRQKYKVLNGFIELYSRRI